ncbi:MAG: deoxyribonuclease IV [Acidobacteria bacterium]|nr:deoxyribonuclease IV [Acidobacteriota bacterium]
MTPPVRVGLHVSIAGSLAAAARKAHELGASTFQIFSASPRMWRAAGADPDDIARLKQLRARYDLRPLVVHGNYLINLAAADRVVRDKSVAAFREEAGRCAAIGAEYLVAHPGNYRGQSVAQAIRMFADSLEQATAGLAAGSLTLLLECTAGQGSALGSRLEELAELRRAAAGKTPLPVGYCLDTCHLLAAGYDIATEEGLEATLEQAQRWLGLESIPVLHANDSKAPLGSHRDRHEHIGKGHIGPQAFGRILRHPKLAGKAFILETPVEKEGDDLRNLRALKRLARRP